LVDLGGSRYHHRSIMPQWFRDRAADQSRYPDERWRAACPPGDVPLLQQYDHHVVWVAGRAALLLTWHWAGEPADDPGAARTFDVSFTYASGHPPAPPPVQAIVDRLVFLPQKSQRERG
jgi:hypothetical protein